MCYVCDVCRDKVGPGLPMLRWSIHRANRQIEKEIKVCPECWDDLRAGVALNIMLQEYSGVRVYTGPVSASTAAALAASSKMVDQFKGGLLAVYDPPKDVKIKGRPAKRPNHKPKETT